jgi:hypothetical protein
MNMKTRTIILTLAAALLLTACVQTNPDAQADPGVQTGLSSQSPDAGNPLLPGYFADPTIVEFDGIYYIYATTDNEMLASGAPTLWYSRDLLNWYNYTLDIPTLESINLRNFWAPDIVKGDDGRYYLYFGNCQAGCNIYGYVSSTPVGPWTKLHQDDTPVIGSGFPRRGFPSLDAQFFRDDDGKIYAYWGTWVHYNGGYAVGELDGKSMSRMINGKNIPLEQTPEPFEAAYVLKHKDKYILMYSSASCHDASYNVRYSYADNPYGPFTPGDNNPILSTNADQSVHGPGHHSVLKQGEDYYIVYHRHDYPMTRGGMARQVCIDSMIFENDSTIRKVIPSHRGIADIFPSELPVDLAFGAKTKASSYYRMNSPGYDYTYKPSFATDNNNATMWKAADNSFPQTLEIDLGSVQKISRVMTQFEFASYYYQYLLEYSTNGKKWAVYADRSDNRVSGSPMIDDKEVEARFLRLKVLGAEKTGIYAAVWNIKAYGSSFDIPLGLGKRIIGRLPHGGVVVVGCKRRLVRIVITRTVHAVIRRGLGFGSKGQIDRQLRRKNIGYAPMRRNHFTNGGIVLKNHAVDANLPRHTAPGHGIIVAMIYDIIIFALLQHRMMSGAVYRLVGIGAENGIVVTGSKRTIGIVGIGIAHVVTGVVAGSAGIHQDIFVLMLEHVSCLKRFRCLLQGNIFSVDHA